MNSRCRAGPVGAVTAPGVQKQQGQQYLVLWCAILWYRPVTRVVTVTGRLSMLPRHLQLGAAVDFNLNWNSESETETDVIDTNTDDITAALSEHIPPHHFLRSVVFPL